MSAVSNSVTPRSIALWITLREVSRSVRWPKLLQPSPTAETRRPEPPRLRICMDDPVGGEEDPHCDAHAGRLQGMAWRDVAGKKSGPGQTRRLTGTAGSVRSATGAA